MPFLIENTPKVKLERSPKHVARNVMECGYTEMKVMYPIHLTEPQGKIKNMSLRRRSRIVAMQILYQIQLTAAPVPIVMERFWQSQDTSAELRPFALELVEGATAHLEAIDTILQDTSKNWKLHRMPVVDLSILRCATYEILYLDDIDAATSINEAVEIAKSYSTPDSPKFINGVLDNIRKKHPHVPES